MSEETEKIKQSEKILNAAYSCISSRGYANVSLREIADEAGVVLSQLNYYYKNKEGLFSEVITIMIHKYLQEVEKSLLVGESAKEKILSLIRYFQKTLDESPELFRLLYDFTSMSLWSPHFGNLLRALFEDLTNLIEKHALNNLPSESNLRDYTPKAVARMLFGAMFGTAIQVILDPQEKKLPEALTTIELVFN
jgi:AcrR family transcriptional regulator